MKMTTNPSESNRREIWPVPPVPFDDSQEVDTAGVDHLVDFYASAGMDGLFVLAYSGEGLELSDEQRHTLCRCVVRRAKGRLPVVAAGNFGGTLAEQIDELNRMADSGPDAVVVFLSTLPGRDRLIDDLLTIARNVSGPLGIYECPVPEHRRLTPQEVGQLAATGRYIFMKETSRDRRQHRDKLEAAAGSPLKVYAANLAALPSALADGCPGFCGIVANAFPELIDAYCNDSALSVPMRQELFETLCQLLDLITVRHYPASMKYVLRRRGIPISTRSQMTGGQDIDAQDRRRLDDALARLEPSGDEDQLWTRFAPRSILSSGDGLAQHDGHTEIPGPHTRLRAPVKSNP